MKSPKQLALESKILKLVAPYEKITKLITALFDDLELQELQEYANTVSIKRLGYNDHGPVHMRQVLYNSLKMFVILKDAGIMMSLETEEGLEAEKSAVSVVLGAFMHDLGMSVARSSHEILSCVIAERHIDKYLLLLYPDDIKARAVIKSMALECILGHMASVKIHSIEAGLILIGDGCDMEKGRARIPLQLNSKPEVGDIHRYSADSITKVSIEKGEEKPIRINVHMDSYAGLFQVEEVLLTKLNISPDKTYVELYAYIQDEIKRYL